ncbi:MAG: tetratricopeptide repeat protein [Rhodobacteraceae bacterium]|nr:tetratricopeptide repeat protein [Paracoccaceae bacterium]
MTAVRLLAAMAALAFGVAAGAATAQKSGQPATGPTPTAVVATGPVVDVLAMLVPADEARAFTDFLGQAPAGVNGDTIGHMLFTRRHFDKAAWFFGTEAAIDPSDPVSLNNYAAMLTEVFADDPGATNAAAYLSAAHGAALQAVAIDPGNAAFQNNLGNAARRLGLTRDAVTAAEAAVRLNPDEPLYWVNLARAHEALGDPAAAAEALARAHALSPNSMVVAFARNDLPSGGPYQGAVQRNCEVNFHCQEICPRSIIGGLMSVTCEMENSSAQLACMEGKPFPTSYNCKEDLPEYGILIPGLNSGFSIAVPGFSVHVVVDGQGNVDVRVEAGVSVGPVGGYVRGDGHFGPSGGVTFDNMGGGVRVSVLPSSPASDLASGLGHPPVHIEVESTGGRPASVNVEVYNAGVISG